MKRVSIVLLGILLCVLLAGCKCEHEWAEATCTEPKTCTKCKETEGEPLGHNWKAATCEEPETCMRCGEKRGTAKGHGKKQLVQSRKLALHVEKLRVKHWDTKKEIGKLLKQI